MRKKCQHHASWVMQGGSDITTQGAATPVLAWEGENRWIG